MTTKTEMTLENVCFRYDGSDGIELKVDNTPKRNNIKSSVYQGNLEHHFKKLTTP